MKNLPKFLSGIFFDKAGEPIELEEWRRLMEDRDYAVIGRSELGWGIAVSTVWIGIGFQHRPMIFETLVFKRGKGTNTGERYATLEDAKAGHLWHCAAQRRLLKK